MSIKKLSAENSERVRFLFDKNQPNLSFIFGVIENTLPGEIWVDHEKAPKSGLVMDNTSYCYLGGALNREKFQQYYDVLKSKSSVKLNCQAKLDFNFADFGFAPIARREYRYQPNAAIPVYENKTAYTLIRIEDEAIFNACNWQTLISQMCGSFANYQKHGYGFVLWDEKNKCVASEAHGVGSKNIIEIGTITHENYRQQGLSTIICNHLIRFLVAKELAVLWTCDDSNTGSWKVAENQGMNDMRRYTFHKLTQTN